MNEKSRDTCRVRLIKTIASDHGVIRVWKCEECKFSYEDANSNYWFCPYCGRRITKKLRLNAMN